jgi:hypothetical protein
LGKKLEATIAATAIAAAGADQFHGMSKKTLRDCEPYRALIFLWRQTQRQFFKKNLPIRV